MDSNPTLSDYMKLGSRHLLTQEKPGEFKLFTKKTGIICEVVEKDGAMAYQPLYQVKMPRTRRALRNLISEYNVNRVSEDAQTYKKVFNAYTKKLSSTRRFFLNLGAACAGSATLYPLINSAGNAVEDFVHIPEILADTIPIDITGNKELSEKVKTYMHTNRLADQSFAKSLDYNSAILTKFSRANYALQSGQSRIDDLVKTVVPKSEQDRLRGLWEEYHPMGLVEKLFGQDKTDRERAVDRVAFKKLVTSQSDLYNRTLSPVLQRMGALIDVTKQQPAESGRINTILKEYARSFDAGIALYEGNKNFTLDGTLKTANRVKDITENWLGEVARIDRDASDYIHIGSRYSEAISWGKGIAHGLAAYLLYRPATWLVSLGLSGYTTLANRKAKVAKIEKANPGKIAEESAAKQEE